MQSIFIFFNLYAIIKVRNEINVQLSHQRATPIAVGWLFLVCIFLTLKFELLNVYLRIS